MNITFEEQHAVHLSNTDVEEHVWYILEDGKYRVEHGLKYALGSIKHTKDGTYSSAYFLRIGLTQEPHNTLNEAKEHAAQLLNATSVDGKHILSDREKLLHARFMEEASQARFTRDSRSDNQISWDLWDGYWRAMNDAAEILSYTDEMVRSRIQEK